MTPWYYPLILLLILIPVAAAAAFHFYYKRRKELEVFTASLGLAFEPEADRLPSFTASDLELFTQGRLRKFTNLIPSSAVGAERVYFFDYSYVTGSGKRRRVHRFTPGCFEFLTPIFPRFELRPETFMDKIGEMIGFVDIDIPGSPEFSKKYRLTGLDKNAVAAFFNPATIRFLEQHPGWRVQASGTRIVLFGKEGLIPVAVYKDYMDECKDLVAAMTGQ